MNEAHAREIAIRIRDEFEDLLDEKNIIIPSADREGDPNEARLYGEENARIEEAIVDLLIEQADGLSSEGDTDDASHPLRQIAIHVCDEFEELLAKKDIMIPSADREGGHEEACLYGEEYWRMEDAVVDILVEEPPAKNTAPRSNTNGIDEEANRACEAMQRRMAATPEGYVAGELPKAACSKPRPDPSIRPGREGQRRSESWK